MEGLYIYELKHKHNLIERTCWQDRAPDQSLKGSYSFSEESTYIQKDTNTNTCHTKKLGCSLDQLFSCILWNIKQYDPKTACNWNHFELKTIL